MRKTLKNELYRIVVDEGLDPKLFTVSDPINKNKKEYKDIRRDIIWFPEFRTIYGLEEPDSNLGPPVFRLRALSSELIFDVIQPNDMFDVFNIRHTVYEVVKGATGNILMQDAQADISWFNVTVLFQTWVRNHVKPYLHYAGSDEQVDLWRVNILQSSSTALVTSLPSEPAYFTREEKSRISASVREFEKWLIQEHSLSGPQLQQLNASMAYLIEGVDRLNKFDWSGMALAIITAIIINMTVDTETGRKIFDVFVSLISTGLNYLP